MIHNPIIRRELIGMLRTRRAPAVMIVMSCVLALLVLLRWPNEARVELSAATSQQVFRVFGYGLMSVLVLLAPVFSATTIVRERAQGTLPLLLNSPLGSHAIVLGKLISAAGYVLLLIILSLPAAAACFAMGGIALIQQLGMLYLLLLVLAIQYATLGLWVSSMTSSVDGALRVTYGLILFMSVLTLAPYQFAKDSEAIQAMTGPMGLAVIEWLRCVSPIPATAEVLGDTAAGAGGLRTTGGVATRFITIAACLSVILTCLCTLRVSGRMLDRSRDAGRVTDERSTHARIYRRIMFLWFFDPQRRTGMIGGLTNPVMIKEQRCRRFGRGHWMMRLLGLCLIASLLLMLLAANQTRANGVETLGGIMVVMQVSLIILITPSLAGGLISGEIESRGWQLLQMTPLSARTIMVGKLMSVVWTLALLLLATLPGYAVLIAIDPSQTPVVLRVVACLSLTAATALLTTAAFSSVFRASAAATAAAYGFLMVLCACTLLFWLGEGSPFGRQLVEVVLMANPLAATLNLIEMPGFEHYQLFPSAWYVMLCLCLVSLAVLFVRTWQLTRPR